MKILQTPAATRPPKIRRLGLFVLLGGFLLGLGLKTPAQETVPIRFVPQVNHRTIEAFDLTPDNQLVVTSDLESTVQVWYRRALQRVHRGHAFALAPTGEIVIATVAENPTLAPARERPDMLQFWPSGSEEDPGKPSAELAMGFPVRQMAFLDFPSVGEDTPNLAVLGPTRVGLLDSGRRVIWSHKAKADAPFRHLVTAPKSKVLAAVRWGKIEIIEIATGRVRRSLRCEDRGLPVMSEDGSRLAAVCDEDKLKVWDTESGKVLTKFSKGSHIFRATLAMNAAGTVVALGSQKDLVRVFDVDAGRTREFPRPSQSLNGLALSENGELLLIADWYPKTTLWDTATGKKLREIATHGMMMTLPRFAAEDQLVHAVAGGAITTFEAESGKLVTFRRASPMATGDLTFSPDGHFLVSKHHRRVRLWNLRDGTSQSFEGQEFAWTHGGAYLLVGPVGGRVQVFAPHRRRFIGDLAADEAISAFAGGWVRGTRNPAFAAPSPPLSETSVADPRIPWGSLAATGTVNGDIQIWDVATLRRSHHMAFPGRAVEDLVISSASGTLFVLFRDRSTTLFDLATGQERAVLRPPTEKWQRRSYTFSPQGRYLATSGMNSKTVDIWQTERPEKPRRVLLPVDGVDAQTFLDETHILLDSQLDMGLMVLDLESLEIDFLAKTDTALTLMSAASQGGLLATGNARGIVEAWRIKSPASPDISAPELDPEPLPLPPEDINLVHHGAEITGLAWSPGGRYLASGDRQGVIRLWALTGTELESRGWLSAIGDETWGVVSPDGRWDGPASHKRGVAAWKGKSFRPLSTAASSRSPGLLASLLPPINGPMAAPEMAESVSLDAPSNSASISVSSVASISSSSEPSISSSNEETPPNSTPNPPLHRTPLPSLQVESAAFLGPARKPAVALQPDGSALVYVMHGQGIAVLENNGDGTLRRLAQVVHDREPFPPFSMVAEGRHLHAFFREGLESLTLDGSLPRWSAGPRMDTLGSGGLFWRDQLLVSLDCEVRRYRRLRLDEGKLVDRGSGAQTFAWTAPEPMALEDPPPGIQGLAADGNHLLYYGSSDNKSLLAASLIEADSEPVFLGALRFEGNIRAVAVEGNLAAVALSHELVLVEIPEHDRLRRLGAIPSPRPNDVALRGGRLYVADDSLGLRVFSLEDPASPRPIAEFIPQGGAAAGQGSGLAWAGDGWIFTNSAGVFLLSDEAAALAQSRSTSRR